MQVTRVPALRAMRPRQWTKNLLVFAAPVAANQIAEPAVVESATVAFVSFCLCASSVYLLNDVLDQEADRRHPTKQHRPVAARTLDLPHALVLAAVLATLGLGVAMWGPVLAFPGRSGLPLVGVMGTYLVIQVLYSCWLKHEPVLDLACVASAFILRAVAGGVASGIELSQWFLMVAGFGSLFVVAGKRASELKDLGSLAGTRRSLVHYSDSYLRFVWGTACAAAAVSYALWAASRAGADLLLPWHALSVFPFVLCLLRYGWNVDRGTAGDPEEVIVRDRTLQVMGVVWLVLTCLGVVGV